MAGSVYYLPNQARIRVLFLSHIFVKTRPISFNKTTICCYWEQIKDIFRLLFVPIWEKANGTCIITGLKMCMEARTCLKMKSGNSCFQK